MANQPETDSYDAGIYQWEITDPAQGGVGGLANAPLLSLANRTNWLKSQIASILASLGNFAGLNSPIFSGSPTVPTAPVGDQSLLISNTAFAQRMFSGEMVISIAGSGNVVLTQAQYGVGIIVLSGTLTGASSVVFPNAGRWVVLNGTTGAFPVTCKTAAGTGFTITQGTSREIWGDGTNIQPVHSDYNSIAMTGMPTAPTQNRGVFNTTVATMQALGGAFPTSFIQVSASTSIGAAFNGQYINVGPNAGTTQTLAPASTVPGMAVGFFTEVGGGFTLASAGGAILGDTVDVTSIAVPVTSYICVQSDGANWRMFSASPKMLGYQSVNTPSDYRLKIVYGLADTGTAIDSVPVHEAAFKTSETAKRPMFLAHELALAAPFAVSGEKDAVDETTGNIKRQMVDHAALVPMLWAEVRALRKRVAAIEADLVIDGLSTTLPPAAVQLP